MNLAAIDWQMIGTVFVALGFIYTILRNNRRDVRDQFTAQQNYIEKIDKKVEALFDKSDKKVEALHALITVIQSLSVRQLFRLHIIFRNSVHLSKKNSGSQYRQKIILDL